MNQPRTPIATNEQIDRWLLRGYVKPEVQRVVLAVWWGLYTLEDAIEEARGIARLIAQKAKVSREIADAVALSAVDEEMQRQEAEHAKTFEVLAEAAAGAIRDGMSRRDARRLIAELAKTRPLLPLPQTLASALEEGARRQRKAEYWWKKREAQA